jgi:hypothetical protein
MFGSTARAGNGSTPAHSPGSATTSSAVAATEALATEAAATEAAAPEAAAAGPHAAGPAGAELRPGEAAGRTGDLSDIAYGNLIPDAAQYRARWHQIQFNFVDDPHASVTEAADVVAQVTAKLEAAIQERQRSLRGGWAEGTKADTETLRETLRLYRAFLDQLIGPGTAS